MIKKLLLSFMLILLAFSFVNNPSVFATEELVGNAEISETSLMFEDYLEACANRKSGTDGEVNASNYILDYTTSLHYSNYKNKRIDSFAYFVNNNTGTSRNILAYKSSDLETDNLVVIGTNYSYEFEQGANNASGTISTMLLMKHLQTEDLPFNILFIFYGASSENLAGSNFFVNSLSNELKQNIIMSITIGNVGAGQNNYYFCANNKTQYETFIKENLQNYAKMPNNALYSKTGKNNFSYSHFGTRANNSPFLKQGINSLYVFSGEFTQYSFREKQGVNLSGKNDTLENCYNAFGSKFYSNTYSCSTNILNLLKSDGFQNIMPTQVDTALYEENLPEFITISVIVGLYVIFVIFYIVKNNLTVKLASKKYAEHKHC